MANLWALSSVQTSNSATLVTLLFQSQCLACCKRRSPVGNLAKAPSNMLYIEIFYSTTRLGPITTTWAFPVFFQLEGLKVDLDQAVEFWSLWLQQCLSKLELCFVSFNTKKKRKTNRTLNGNSLLHIKVSRNRKKLTSVFLNGFRSR